MSAESLERTQEERLGILLLLSGPAGSGKSTILRKALEEDKGLAFSVSCTTRPPREGETDGVDYHFLTDENFSYFFDQYFFDHRPPKLEYYQDGKKLFYRWADVIPNFQMPLDVNINGIEKRIYPTAAVQILQVPEFPVVIFRNWEFLISVKENSALGR